LLVDIDDFKGFNDAHGHMIGDEVIRFIARKIVKNIRGRDFVSRYGGEEFAVVLPKTSLVGAKAVAENIRNYFDQAKLKTAVSLRSLGKVTVSIGVSSYRPGEPIEELISRADQALYTAKNSGRNRICTEDEEFRLSLKN
jgi:diguanylate cyclase